MKIAFVLYKDDKTSWNVYVKALAEKGRIGGIDIVTVTDVSDMLTLSTYDAVILFQEQPPLLDAMEMLKVKKYVYLHGGMPYEVDDYVSSFREMRAVRTKNLFDGFFCNTYCQRDEYVRNGFDREKIHVAGFPVVFDVLEKYHSRARGIEKDEKLIMCPGRFDPEKMVPLFAYMLQSFVSEGYKVVFCTPFTEKETEYFDPQIVLFTKAMERRGFIVKYGIPSEEYFCLMGKAKYVVVRGIADSLNLVTLEAMYFDAEPVVPRINPFVEFVPEKFMYEPFSMEDFARRIKNPPFWLGVNEWKRYEAEKSFERMERVING